MDDIDPAEQAFVAYFTTVTGRPSGEVTLEGLRDGRIIAQALNHERVLSPCFVDFSIRLLTTSLITCALYRRREPEHFPPALPESELTDQAGRQRYLKRIYHDLLTCPSCNLASYLPIPDISVMSDLESDTPQTSTSPSTNANKGTWQTELLALCRVALLVQAVWSNKNAGVIGVITELKVDDQRVLKGVIESALSSMVPAQGTGVTEETDIQAEMLYSLQMDRRRTRSEKEQLVRQVEELRGQMEVQQMIVGKTKMSIGTPDRRRLAPNGSHTTTPTRRPITPTGSDEEPDPTPSSEFPVTPLRNKTLVAGGKSMETPASPMERMKNLEIERLKHESEERAEEVSRLEEVVEQGKKAIAGHLQKIATLEKETQEIHSLRDELEVRKHASDNLKKSEATLEKMKKRLEEVGDLKERIQVLGMQNKELTDTNALLEDKYKELSSSRTIKVGSTPEAVKEEAVPDLTRQATNDLEHLLRRDLRQREDEVEELRLRVEELEHEAQVPAQGGTLGDVAGLTSDVESRSRMTEREDDDMTDEQVIQMLRVKEDNVLLKEQVKALDQRLVAAKELLKEQEERQNSAGRSTAVPADAKRIQELEKTIERLKRQQSEADERFHLERIIALKSWKDLGKRAPRPTRDRTT